MKTQSRPSLKKNFIMNALLTMSSFLFPLITFPYVSRILGPEGFGRVSFATSVVAYFNMLAQLGIPTYGIRICASLRDDREALTRTAHELLLINLLMGLLSWLMLASCLAVVPRLRQERELLLLISATIFLNAIGMEWLYKGLEQYTYITVRSVAFKALAVVAMFLMVHSPEDCLAYGAVSIFASSASNILNFVHAGSIISLRPVGGYNLKRHMKVVAVFFAMACATTIYTNLDEVMLGFMKSNADVGYYHAAVKIKNILVSIVTALGAVLLPRASYYIEQGRYDEFWRITRKALHFVLLAASPMMLYFTLFAREGILLVSGGAYENAVLPMQIIMPTLLLIGVTNVLGIQMLVPLGREKCVLYSEIAGAVTDLILNALLIPRYAAAGAAIGTLTAEIVVLVVQYISLRDEIKDYFCRFPYKKILPALMVSCAACIWVKRLSLGSFPALVLSASCFFGGYVASLLCLREPLLGESIVKLRDKLGRK